MKTALLSTLYFLLSCAFVYAHGSGVSFEETKEGYKVDIGHEEFIAENESVRFDFALYPQDIKTVEEDVFTDVWVTFTKDRKIFFAGGINKPVFGTTGFTYVFPETGVYTVSARFEKDGETVVKSEFPITVILPLDYVEPTPAYIVPLISGVSSFICGGIVSVLLTRRKKIYEKNN